jgi:hypothetical protein
MAKKDDFRTAATRNPKTETFAGSNKTVAGDSVDKLRNLEEANTLISGDEIQQQNENL